MLSIILKSLWITLLALFSHLLAGFIFPCSQLSNQLKCKINPTLLQQLVISLIAL